MGHQLVLARILAITKPLSQPGHAQCEQEAAALSDQPRPSSNQCPMNGVSKYHARNGLTHAFLKNSEPGLAHVNPWMLLPLKSQPELKHMKPPSPQPMQRKQLLDRMEAKELVERMEKKLLAESTESMLFSEKTLKMPLTHTNEPTPMPTLSTENTMSQLGQHARLGMAP